MRYFLSGVSGGMQGGTQKLVSTGTISSARCYEPNQVLGMVLEQVDARGVSRRVFVDRLQAGDRPIPSPGTQSATSGSSTRRTTPLPGVSSSNPLNRRFNGALPTVSVAQIRVDTMPLPNGSNRHLLKTYFTADAARSPVVLCVAAAAKKPSPARKVPEMIVRKGFGQSDRAKTISKIGKTSFWAIPKATQTVQVNAETLRREAERQAAAAQQARTIQEQQAALERMAALLAEAEKAAAEAVALANEAAARAQSAEERAVAAEAKKQAEEIVATVEETKDVASDVGVTGDGNGNVVIDPNVTTTPPEDTDQPVTIETEAEVPLQKSKTPLLLLAAAAVGGYLLLNG